jgi:hypothetical protein
MPKMTKAELAKRKKSMTARAREEVAKTEVVQFRVDTDSIEKLYNQATKAKMPLGTMVRQWVLERLTVEEKGTSGDMAQAYFASIESLHERLDRLEKSFASVKSTRRKIRKSEAI